MKIKSLANEIKSKKLSQILIIGYFALLIVAFAAKLLTKYDIGILPMFVDLVFSFAVIIIFIFTFIIFASEIRKEEMFDDKVVDILISIISLIVVIVLFFQIRNYCMDIPNVVNSNYKVVSGVCTDKDDRPGKGSCMYFNVNKTTFTIHKSYRDEITDGRRIEVKFLPNSKHIISIKFK